MFRLLPRGLLLASLLVSAPSFAAASDLEPLWMSEGPPSTFPRGLASILTADPAPHPLDPFWVPMLFPALSMRATRFELTEHEGELVVVGRFGSLGAQRAQRGLAWDGSQFTDLGLAALTWAFSVLEWNGDLVAAGRAVPGPGETIFRRTGSGWGALATTNGDVRALAVFEGDLVAAGDFTVIDGVAANRVARFDGTSWAPMGTGLTAGVTVNDLLAHGGYLYVAGLFSSPNPIKGIGRWDGASWSTVGTGLGQSPNGSGETHQLATDGVDLYAGGSFAFAGSDPLAGVGRWDGTSWNSVASNSSSASAIAWWDGALYSNIPITGGRISRLSGGLWTTTGDGLTGSVIRLGVARDRLVAAGNFGPASGAGELSSLHEFDGTAWARIDPSGESGMTGLDGTSYAAVVAHDRLYVSGEVTNAGNSASGLRVNGVGAWDGSSWSMLQNGALPQPLHVESVDGDVILGGWFSVSDPIQNIARWDGTNWFGYGAGVDQLPAYTWGAATYQGSLFAGGEFSWAGGSRLVQWNGSAWANVGGGVGLGSGQAVFALSAWNDALVAAGRFTNAGGAPASNIARWDGAMWHTLGAGLNGESEALAALGPDLVVGGSFTEAGGVPAVGAARWDGTSWHPLGTRAVRIRDFAVVDGVLYAGGIFLAADESHTGSVARWTGVDWELMGSGGDPVSVWKTSIHWVEGYHGDLYVGGHFNHLMGKVTAHIMRLPSVNLVGVGGEPRPMRVALAASPNPIRGLASFSFTLPVAGHVRLRVFDASGRLVTTLLDGDVVAGEHSVPWRASARPGVYFAQLETPDGERRVARVVQLDP